ncbi:hypothetical protein M0R89_13950 [Halorussus limi]|uniref:Uncharacterized protein n=1 Tax=Halorussus limi TaxID=2938695 RepID=A0A8U0HRY2_9EURY|nr:hypothetical protein [Halorussus limi]UPV73637.1 hypothetical protein M0R89_13950 [Halorussus limi]
MEKVPDDWPYADEPTVCAACGSDDDRHVTVETLGLVWGAAMDGGLAPTAVGGYSGTLRFRCCHECWTERGIDALEAARTLVDRGGRAEDGRPFALDDDRVAAAAELDAERVAVGDLRRPEFRSDPEREHVRSQDEAVEAALDSWFDRE